MDVKPKKDVSAILAAGAFGLIALLAAAMFFIGRVDAAGYIPALANVNMDFIHVKMAILLVMACLQAGLAAIFFMGLWGGKPAHLLVFAAALMFAAAFIVVVLTDTLHRGDADAVEAVGRVTAPSKAL